MFFLLTHPEVFSIVVSIVFRLLSDSLQDCKLKRLSFDNTVVLCLVLSGNFSVSLVLKPLCTETLTKVHSEQPDAVWPVYSWASSRLIVDTPHSVGPTASAVKWRMQMHWLHSQSRCVVYLWLLSLGESYSTNRSCFLNDLHRLLKGYDGKTFPISIPAIRIKEQSDQQVM